MRIFYLLLIICPLLCISSTIEVCASCDVKTIEQGLSRSEAHDTLFIKAGTYSAANVDIIKPVTILGEKGTVLDGMLTGYVLKIHSDSVNISGITIINSGRSYTKDFAAIYSFKVEHFSITNCTIIDPFFGILIEKSKHGTVADNLVYGVSAKEDDSGNGIHAWHCVDVTIKDNEVYKMRDGIYMEFVNESRVIKNYMHDNVRYGLHFMFSNHDNYHDNIFERNGAGVAVMFSKFIEMKRNKFITNWGTASYGLLLKEIYDAEVVDNDFKENTVGIFIEGSTRINYLKNDFESNGWAIKVSGGCYTNKFSNNNFIGNSFDVSYNGKMNDNTFHGNYWSSYSGYDLDKDGQGDVPYRPVKLFSYVVNQTPETIILLRSLFVDIINFSERVSPIFTPDQLVDELPSMKEFR